MKAYELTKKDIGEKFIVGDTIATFKGLDTPYARFVVDGQEYLVYGDAPVVKLHICWECSGDGVGPADEYCKVCKATGYVEL